MRHRGTVKKVNTERGFAFIRVPGEPDVFAHISGFVLPDGQLFDESLQELDVEFDLVPGRDGRMKAIDVRPAR